MNTPKEKKDYPVEEYLKDKPDFLIVWKSIKQDNPGLTDQRLNKKMGDFKRFRYKEYKGNFRLAFYQFFNDDLKNLDGFKNLVGALIKMPTEKITPKTDEIVDEGQKQLLENASIESILNNKFGHYILGLFDSEVQKYFKPEQGMLLDEAIAKVIEGVLDYNQVSLEEKREKYGDMFKRFAQGRYDPEDGTVKGENR